MRLLLFPFFFLLGLLPFTASGKDFTATIDETRPLQADGEIRLKNVNGSVVIQTWDRAEVRIQAVKEARSESDLNSLEVRIEGTPEQLSIKTEYLKKDGSWFKKWTNTGEVRYTLTVPRGAHLREVETVNGTIEITGVHGRVNASSVNGRIKAAGLRHEVELETVNGTITAAFEIITDKQDVYLHTVNGGIELTIPADTSAEVKAGTVNGRITNEFNLHEDREGWVGRDLAGRLGSGAGRIRLDTVNGAIALKKFAPSPAVER